MTRALCVSAHTLVSFPQVTVIDGPVTTRQSTVWVIVHIEDENDNPPTFPEVTYRISLPERDRNKRGEPVYRVFAYDRDLGANGNITYSIVDGNDDEKFSIDPRTAMVSSKKMVTAGSYDVLTVSFTSRVIKVIVFIAAISYRSFPSLFFSLCVISHTGKVTQQCFLQTLRLYCSFPDHTCSTATSFSYASDSLIRQSCPNALGVCSLACAQFEGS